MNFLDKAKKKQAELKAQYDKVSKELSSFGIGDKSSNASQPASSPAQTPASSTAPSELQGKSVSRQYAELDNTEASSKATPITTPATTTATSEAAAPPSVTAALPARTSVKLSLVQRKDVRSTWDEAGKPTLEEKLSKTLGTKWTLDADAGYLLNVKGDGVAADVSAPGSMIEDYMSSAVRAITDLVEWHGKDAAYEINVLAPKRVISLEIDTEIVKEVSAPDQYNRADFHDGRLRILIHRDHLWSNTPNTLSKLKKLILEARSENEQLKNEIDYVGKHGIRVDWEKEIESQLDLAREYLDDPGFVFDPRFAEVWKGLDTYARTKPGKKQTKDMIWPETLGRQTFGYFLEFVNTLKSEKFEDDEMLQETFKEAVPKRVVAFRLVEQTAKKPHEFVVDDGILYMQTRPEDFWSGPRDMYETLMQVL